MYDQFFGIQQRRPFTDIVHAGNGADEVGGSEVTRHIPQLLRRVKMHRPVVFLTGGQQTRLVLLQVDGTDAADGRCVQAIFREHCLHRTHHRFGRDAPPATYAYPQHARDQPQGAGKGCSDVPADENTQRAGLPGKRTLRQGDRQVKLATKRHVPLQYRRRYRLGKPHVGDGTAVPGGPCVHGEFSPDVGGGGDHRRGV